MTLLGARFMMMLAVGLAGVLAYGVLTSKKRK